MAKIAVPMMMRRRTMRESLSAIALSSSVTMPSSLRSRLRGGAQHQQHCLGAKRDEYHVDAKLIKRGEK